MPFRSCRRGAGAILLLALAPVGVSAATGFEVEGPLEGLPIRRIEVRALNLFEPAPAGRLRPLYHLVNRLHLTTRPRVIREQLLFRRGEPWSESRGRETARALRNLDILEPVRLEARRAGDSVDVRVETRDAWTTAPQLAIEGGGGQHFLAVSVVERNLFGLAKSIHFVYDETPEGVFRSVGYRDPALGGSRWRLGINGGTGSEGAAQSLELAKPFYAEDAPESQGLTWSRQTSVARLYQDGGEVAEFDRRVEEAEAWWGRGIRKGAAIWRLTGLFVLRDRRWGPSRLAPGAPAVFDGVEENRRTRMLGLEGRWWRPDFREWTGVDRLGSVEDIDLGSSLRLTTGFSPSALGASRSEGYVAVRAEQGGSPAGWGFGQVNAELRSWSGTAPRESWGRLRGRWVQRLHARHVLVSSGLGVLGHRMPRDFQEIVGGLTGLRAYSVREIAGAGIARFNLEHRWLLSPQILELVSLGAVGFYDAAREIGPGAGDAPWRHGAGFGLRLSLPRSSQLRVARFDVAWPLAPGHDGRRAPVFSFGSSQVF